jgi:hypothetical protein
VHFIVSIAEEALQADGGAREAPAVEFKDAKSGHDFHAHVMAAKTDARRLKQVDVSAVVPPVDRRHLAQMVCEMNEKSFGELQPESLNLLLNASLDLLTRGAQRFLLSGVCFAHTLARAGDHHPSLIFLLEAIARYEKALFAANKGTFAKDAIKGQHACCLGRACLITLHCSAGDGAGAGRQPRLRRFPAPVRAALGSLSATLSHCLWLQRHRRAAAQSDPRHQEDGPHGGVRRKRNQHGGQR